MTDYVSFCGWVATSCKKSGGGIFFRPRRIICGWVCTFYVTFLVMTQADQSVLHMNEMLKADGSLLLATFPNVGIALRLYFIIIITNWGRKIILYVVESKESSAKKDDPAETQALSLMCIESEVLQSIDFNDLNNDFANRTTRKRGMYLTCEKLKKMMLMLLLRTSSTGCSLYWTIDGHSL